MQQENSSQMASQTALSRRKMIKVSLLAGLGVVAVPGLLAACGSEPASGDQTSGSASGGQNGTQSATATGSQSATGSAAAGDGKGLTVGLSLGTLAQRRWQFDNKYMQEAADRLGIKLLVQSANDDTRLQASQVENLLSQNIDVLILSPIDVKASAPSVAAAKAAGVPVISYNSVVADSDIDFWVARDNVKVGSLQAELAVAAVPKGNYLIISGEGGVDIAQQKTEGNMQVLQPHIDSGDITVVSQRYHQGWDPAGGLAQLEDALSVTSNKIDAVLCNYDGFIVSALPALKSAGLLGTTWLGGEDVFLEVAQAIVQGNAAMSAFTPLKEMAETAIDAAVALGKGESPASDATVNNGSKDVQGKQVVAIAVTEESMRGFLEETGWLTVDEVYAAS